MPAVPRGDRAQDPIATLSGPAARRSAGYRRAAGSARGEKRKRELLARVVDDLTEHGLVDYSLRRTARAAGTTHKVLLYYFDSAEDLLAQAVVALRARRIDNALAAVARRPGRLSLAEWVQAVWPVIRDAATGVRVLDQAIGLTMYDPARYADLGREATRQYLPAVLAACPAEWTQERREEVAHLIIAAIRGLLVGWLASGDVGEAEQGLRALTRALDREVAAPE